MAKHTQHLLALMLSIALVLGLLSACAPQGEVQSPPPSELEPSPTQTESSPSPSEEPTPSADPAEQLSAQNIVNSLYFSMFEAAGSGERMYEAYDTDFYLTNVFGMDRKDCESFGMLIGVDTLAVLRCTDEDAAQRAEAALRGYAGREAENPGGNPAGVYRQGLYLGLFQWPDPDMAADAFFSILSTGERLDRTAPVTDPPDFELGDLLIRLLVEGGACPEWRTLGPWDKGWTDPKNNGSGLFTVAAAYGAVPAQYEECRYAYWDPENRLGWIAHSVGYPCQLVLFQTAGEDEAKVLLPMMRQTLELRLENTRKKLALYTSENFDLQELRKQQPDFDLEKEVDRLTRLLAGMENAQVVQSGRYAALLICEDPVQLAVALPRFIASPDTKGFMERYFQVNQSTVQVTPDPNYPDRELFTPPNEEDMSLYDTAPILSAWEKGDPAGLSDYDKEIYSAAEQILGEIITDGMTDLEKETAVYTWLTENVDYDWSHMDIMAETTRDAYGPYGGLVNQSAVCLGYATSFQLLMDMAGIECVTVVGAAFHSTGDHVWNMVKLGGKWYCVDPTWDANGHQQSGEEYEWRYFNVTSDEMAKDHQWNYANVPEAETEGNG